MFCLSLSLSSLRHIFLTPFLHQLFAPSPSPTVSLSSPHHQAVSFSFRWHDLLSWHWQCRLPVPCTVFCASVCRTDSTSCACLPLDLSSPVLRSALCSSVRCDSVRTCGRGVAYVCCSLRVKVLLN